MSKPIFIIKLPKDVDISRLEQLRVDMENHQISKDYHILSYIGLGEEEFQCFNSPHTDIQFEELKETIINMLKTK